MGGKGRETIRRNKKRGNPDTLVENKGTQGEKRGVLDWNAFL